MTKTVTAPLGALFCVMKKYGGISYKELASLILSEKPLVGGMSPISRAGDRTWVSRYLVHAPVGAVKTEYFVSCRKCAMRIISRLKKHMRNSEVIMLLADNASREMASALSHCGQNVYPYLNMLERLTTNESFKIEERLEFAMVLLVSVAFYADVPRAMSYTLDFIEDVNGSSPSSSLTTPRWVEFNNDPPVEAEQVHLALGLLRVIDGYACGSPFWLDSTSPDTVEVGAFATGKNAVSDVAPDVSRHHALVWHDNDGEWFIKGLGSTNGTLLISGIDKSETVVEPPRTCRHEWENAAVPIKPGDELVFGKTTHYLVIAGVSAPCDGR